MKILILGANGFMGSHLCEAILKETDWFIYAMDLSQDKLQHILNHKKFYFQLGDMRTEKNWVSTQIKNCDVILPLAAIATPMAYVQDPLRVFELDFEANLAIVRQCVQHGKRLVFPSTSEVYGMCRDLEFDEEKSCLVTGPIHKERWIYAASKQLLDRLIYAYGRQENFSYTLFRPFNWYGPRLDNVHNRKPGGSRVLTQFIGNILRRENIVLVNGGEQRRSFTYIDDGIKALLCIIENKNQCAHNKIFNVGNPSENLSIAEIANLLITLTIEFFPSYASHATNLKLVHLDGKNYYGENYQDVDLRIPSIARARTHLNWKPETDIKTGLKKTLDFYLINPRH